MFSETLRISLLGTSSSDNELFVQIKNIFDKSSKEMKFKEMNKQDNFCDKNGQLTVCTLSIGIEN